MTSNNKNCKDKVKGQSYDIVVSSEQIGSESTVYDKIYTCTESHAAIRALHKP